MRTTFLHALVFASMLLCANAAGVAGLIGSTVDVTANFPTSTSVYDDPGAVTVSNAIEYPAGSYPKYNRFWQVNLSDNQLILDWTAGFAGSFTSAPFNGFVMTVISGPGIMSATVDASSVFAPVSISIENGNQLLLNYQGVSISPSQNMSIIDVVTASVVPEPSTLTLMCLGIAGWAGSYRRRREPAAVERDGYAG
jgi:hypothetical protein